MIYNHILMPRELAWEILNKLGEVKCLHFVDLNPNLPLIARPFANYIKRCDEVTLKLDFIEHEILKF